MITPEQVPVLADHQNVAVVGQVVAAIVAVVSFAWAGRTTRRRRATTDRRNDYVEEQVGGAHYCNPGRRSTDRCQWCPHDETCGRVTKLSRSPEEKKRDEEQAEALRKRQRTVHVPGVVVVVEDHEVVLQVTLALLKQVGIAARGARSIHEVLPVLHDDDVLVTDWYLPDGTGRDLISAFRSVKNDLPVIVMSAQPEPPEDVPENVAWLAKPFDPDYFLALVRRMRTRERRVV